MRYRYDQRVAIAGLALGALTMAVGLLFGHREAAGALAMATIVTATLVAYARVPDRPTEPGQEEGGRRHR
jgi:uncharacterized membrane protein (UPF0136 family)